MQSFDKRLWIGEIGNVEIEEIEMVIVDETYNEAVDYIDARFSGDFIKGISCY